MIRTYSSKFYNWSFDTSNGTFMRWGKTKEDNPIYSDIGPEILDLEISTICHGPSGKPCSFCYKNNTPNGTYMSFDTFKLILDKMPSNLMQIAFGIGDIDSNPDLERILQYTRSKNIVPNITINGYRLSESDIRLLVNNCGSIAVSRYNDNDCFDAVYRLTEAGAKQVNIHQVFHDSTVSDCLHLIGQLKLDRRLTKLNAVLFLMLKPTGRARDIIPTKTINQFKLLLDKALDVGTPIGFDSCSAPLVLECTKYHLRANDIHKMIEPCEAFLFSSYANVKGEFFPCSFYENELKNKGLKVIMDTNFIKDIWYNETMNNWRVRLLNSSSNCNCQLKTSCRNCPIFNITPCKEPRYES